MLKFLLKLFRKNDEIKFHPAFSSVVRGTRQYVPTVLQIEVVEAEEVPAYKMPLLNSALQELDNMKAKKDAILETVKQGRSTPVMMK